jgi:hypothetical protein
MTDFGIAAHGDRILFGANDADMVGKRFDLGVQGLGTGSPKI